jgi:hypothetical protein
VDQETLEVFSAERYKEDEKFWFEELSSPIPSELSEAQPPNSPSGNWVLAEAESISHSILESLCQVYDVDRCSLLIGVYMVALWLSDRRKEYTLVIALDNKEVFPVRVSVQAESGFNEIVQAVQAKIEAGKEHRLFALRAIVNMMQMPAGIMRRPVFDGAYMEAGEAIGPDRFSGFTAATHSGLEVILSVGGNGKCEFSLYSQRPDQSARHIGASLPDILAAAAEEPEVRLSEMQFLHTFQTKPTKSQEEIPQFAF